MNSSLPLGRLLMVGFAGPNLDDSTIGLINELGINNFILFRRNVESPQQLTALCSDLEKHCLQAGLGPPLISIDQEGGTVARLPPPFSQFDNARVLAEADDAEQRLTAYVDACVRELSEVGINMNLAPVLDVCPAGQGFFMEKRVLGADSQKAGRLGALIIDGLQRGGIAACGKHFPGLGGARLDPHLRLPVVSREAAQLREIDLPPFRSAIAAGVAALMTSHTIYSDLDASTPATLSAKVLRDLLRGELGFAGLIITDDLEMGAIENECSVAEAGMLAFVAGADMLLICHDHDKVRQSHARLMLAVEKGEVDPTRCHDSLLRIEAVRKRFAGKKPGC